MRIVDILSEDLVVPEIQATKKPAVIEELVDHLARARPDVDRAEALSVLLEREKLGSTGVGNGFAIPHGKLSSLTRVIACLGRSPKGVDFSSLDGRPAYLFFALFAPQGSAGLHLKALARASRLFKEESFRAQLLAESQAANLWRLIREQDERLALGDDARR